jgi:preprotein translocase subunit YajC
MGGAGGGEGQGGGFSIILPLLLIMVIFYFLLIRPQQRSEKRKKEMIASVKKGYRVITAGGIRGTVAKVYEKDKIVVVTVAKGVDIEVALAKIEAAAPPGEDIAVGGAERKEGTPAARPKERKALRRPRRR